MNAVRAAAVQMDCAVGNVQRNLQEAERRVRQAAADGARLVCLPELFLTGFDRQRLWDLAEPLDGPSLRRLRDLAVETGAWIVAGFAERDGDQLYNAAAVLPPASDVPPRCYRKVHLYGEDHDCFTPGSEPCLVEMPFGKAAVAICFDFCFPDYIASLVEQGAELIVHPTAWFSPAPLDQPGHFRNRGLDMVRRSGAALLTANHCGPVTAEGDLRGVGYSAVIHNDGTVLAQCREEPGIASAVISLQPGGVP
jgi:predicted amidohydrolase